MNSLDGIYIKEGKNNIFIPSSDIRFQTIKQNILIQNKKEIIIKKQI